MYLNYGVDGPWIECVIFPGVQSRAGHMEAAATWRAIRYVCLGGPKPHGWEEITRPRDVFNTVTVLGSDNLVLHPYLCSRTAEQLYKNKILTQIINLTKLYR